MKYNLATKCICEQLNLGLYRHYKCSNSHIFPYCWCDTIKGTTILTFTMYKDRSVVLTVQKVYV